MCGRYVLRSDPQKVIKSLWGEIQGELPLDKRSRFNIGPSHSVSVLATSEGYTQVRELVWGWKPKWSSGVLFNATVEAIRDKSSTWLAHAQYRPVLIPADGFYEPLVPKRSPYPWFGFEFADQRPFFFAGLSAIYKGQAAFAIITKPPNQAIAPVHHRMGVLWDENQSPLYHAWMDTDRTWGERLEALETPIEYGDLNHHRVGELAKSLSNEGPACFEPAPEAPEQNELF
jgi:putative SOS response-associated peptidase YedK